MHPCGGSTGTRASGRGVAQSLGPDEDERHASHEVVDQFHLFLLVFVYVFGGVLQFVAPFLPGINVSQGQFSCLLVNATPKMARSGQSRTSANGDCLGC